MELDWILDGRKKYEGDFGNTWGNLIMHCLLDDIEFRLIFSDGPAVLWLFGRIFFLRGAWQGIRGEVVWHLQLSNGSTERKVRDQANVAKGKHFVAVGKAEVDIHCDAISAFQ